MFQAIDKSKDAEQQEQVAIMIFTHVIIIKKDDTSTPFLSAPLRLFVISARNEMKSFMKQNFKIAGISVISYSLMCWRHFIFKSSIWR